MRVQAGPVRVAAAHLSSSGMDAEEVVVPRVWTGGLCLPASRLLAYRRRHEAQPEMTQAARANRFPCQTNLRQRQRGG